MVASSFMSPSLASKRQSQTSLAIPALSTPIACAALMYSAIAPSSVILAWAYSSFFLSMIFSFCCAVTPNHGNPANHAIALLLHCYVLLGVVAELDSLGALPLFTRRFTAPLPANSALRWVFCACDDRHLLHVTYSHRVLVLSVFPLDRHSFSKHSVQPQPGAHLCVIVIANNTISETKFLATKFREIVASF